LDELITVEGDGTQFFEKTYITQGMQDLISEGMARLAGVSTRGVFHLKQAMGGGKTHLLVGFGLLAEHHTLRKQYCGGPPYAQAFEVADIAVFSGAEAIADEIAATYPLHPRLKNVVALFKANEQFKQTRGLIELVSRLLRSVWERQANDVLLIGPRHFDLAIPEVRDKLTEISGMRDAIAKDLWDAQKSAHAQVIDLETGK